MKDEKRGRGRPPKQPEDLITLDRAVSEMKDYLLAKYKSQEIVERKALAKRTLYNKISSGELHNWSDRRCALVSRAEVLRLVS